LHHEFEGRPEETPLKLIDVVAELIVQLCLFGHIGVIDAKLSFSNELVPVSEVDEKIAIVGFESIFYSEDLKLPAVLGGLGRFHFLEEFDDLLRCVSFDFAAKKVINIEDELASSLAILQAKLS
jgi:hypothetical protein